MSEFAISDNTSKILKKALDILAKRQSLITSNIANMDTIGYKPKDIDFKKTLQKAFDSTGSKKQVFLSTSHPKHYIHGKNNFLETSLISDENITINEHNLDSVNIDTQMIKLIDNNIKYRTCIEMLLKKSSMLKFAISEGGK